jgi:hypothetical protein
MISVPILRRRTGALPRMITFALVAVAVWSCGQAAPSATNGSPSASQSAASSAAVGSGAIAAVTPESSPSPWVDVAGQTSDTATPSITDTPAATPSITDTPQPTPGPPAPTPKPVTVTIVAAGDIACDPAHNVGQPTDCDQAATAALIGALHPTAVLTLGDNQYENGTPAGFQKVFDPSWGTYKSIMYPTIGNHEYLTSGAAGYFGYFHVPAYYSYNLGDWHIISLDSECQYVGGCGAGSKQETWLKENLAAYPYLCTLVTWHEPRWSSGEHQDAKQMATMWADLVAARVDVVLSGHNHDYERFVPLDANGQPSPDGTAEFVVGTGGKNHYGFVTAPLAGEVIRDSTSFGVLRMSLGSTGYSWKFVPAAGYTFTDSGSAACH